jgi:CheY-like chemotaxis protein/anti-sigma regulatory factor (Ser/Thr protein kinase)
VLYDGGLVAAVEWLARRMEQQHSLTVAVRAAGAIEPLDESIRVLLYQGARELLFNVVKHSHADGAEVVLRSDVAHEVSLAVSDRGVGFEPARLGSEGTKGGFGLFSIRERLELLGGRMEIETTAGAGTCVRLVAARQAAAAPAPAASPPATARRRPAPPATEQAARRIRVLLADDHEILRDGLVGLLAEEPDFELVGEACDGQQAVELALSARPDVVLMDITMPRLSGIEATRVIRASLPDVRIIGLSMHEDPALTAMMREAGADAYFPKSGPSTELIRAIRNQETA